MKSRATNDSVARSSFGGWRSQVVALLVGCVLVPVAIAFILRPSGTPTSADYVRMALGVAFAHGFTVTTCLALLWGNIRDRMWPKATVLGAATLIAIGLAISGFMQQTSALISVLQ